MQTQKHQISYERGIVENVAQHLVGQQGMEISLLWLENYNPNIEHKSLIKRLQHRPILEDALNWKNVSAAAIGARKTLSDDHVIHCSTMLLTANPQSHKTYVVFGNRAVSENNKTVMHTGIASYCLEYDPALEEYDPRWRHPFVQSPNPLHTLSQYKGWSPRGIFQDFSRFSESLLFVTIPRDIDEFDPSVLAPCYKWFWFDITKKRLNENKWWNGLTFGNLENKEQSTWIVKSPSRIDNVGMAWYDRTGALQRESNTTEKDIEIVFAENDLVWYSDKYPASQVSWFAPDLCDVPDDNIQTDDIQFGYRYPDSYLKTWSAPQLKHYRADIADESSYPYELRPFSWYTTGKDSDNDNIPVSLISTDEAFVKDDKVYQKTHINALSHVLPNYIQMRVPRLWAKGEKIPFVITAEVNGAEFIIMESEYEVSTYKSMFLKGNINIPGLLNVPADARTNIESAITNIGFDDEGKTKYYGFWSMWNKFFDNNTPDTVWAANKNILMSGCPFVERSTDTNELVFGSALNFTIKIKKSALDKLIEQNVTSFNFYVSQPSERKGLIKTVGIIQPQDFDNSMYAFPATDDQVSNNSTDYSLYRLVKKFVIEGANTEPQWDIYNGLPFNTNSWKETTVGGVDYIFAIPVDEYGIPDSQTTFDFANIYTDEQPAFTPDFILWDYPTDSEPLNLEFSGKTWNGKGARLITVVKGEVFLGGCIDEYGVEEQGTVRYCLFQSGVPLYDVFPLENKIQIGHLPHTALVEYREQLIWFNKQQHFRMIMPSIFEPATWEFLDSVDGGGTYSQKTVCKTPNGIAYCNASGIWLTDGRIPENLTDQPEQMLSIRATYEHIIHGNAYEVKHLWDFGDAIIGSGTNTTVDLNYGHNMYAELHYDDVNDELILSSPLYRVQPLLEMSPYNVPNTYHDFTHEIRLILSFAKKNWRTEIFSLNGQITWTDEQNALQRRWRHIELFTRRHKTKITDAGSVSTVLQWGPWTNEDGTSYTGVFEDLYLYYTKQSLVAEPTWDEYLNFDNDIQRFRVPIIGMFVTHVIGDNINDGLLRRFVLGTVPRGQHINQSWRWWGNYTYDITWDTNVPTLSNLDPIFACYLRSENYARQLPQKSVIQSLMLPAGWSDIMNLNMVKYPAALNPWASAMQTPGGVSAQNIDPMLARESLIMHAPINTPFRRMQLLFASEVVIKLHDFTTEYNVMRRRTI